MKLRVKAPTSSARSPDTIAAATAQTMAQNSIARIAHCQNDHSPMAAVHNTDEVLNRMFSATANIMPVADRAMPRPAFSNVMHTTSPIEHPYSTSNGLPPLVLIAATWPSNVVQTVAFVPSR